MTNPHTQQYLSYGIIANLYDQHRGKDTIIELHNVTTALFRKNHYNLDITCYVTIDPTKSPRQLWSNIHYMIQSDIINEELDVDDFAYNGTDYWMSPDATWNSQPQHFIKPDDIVTSPIPDWVYGIHDLAQGSTNKTRVPLHLRIDLVEDMLDLIEFDYDLHLDPHYAEKYSDPVDHIWIDITRNINADFKDSTLRVTSESRNLHGIDILSIDQIK